MKKVSLVILDNDQDNLNRCREYFDRNEGFELLGFSDSGLEGWRMIQELHPDVLLCSLILREIDGSGVLEKVTESGLDTTVIMMSGFSDDALINRVISKGASYFIVKPFDPENIAARMLGCFKDKQNPSALSIEKRRALDEEISRIFISIGIPPHIKGYSYLREGIKMTVMKPSIINNVTKELYPKIGEKFETSASKVERAIRHAIEVAWNRGRIDAINSIFGTRVYIGTEKPTNSEFIALVADKLILENML